MLTLPTWHVSQNAGTHNWPNLWQLKFQVDKSARMLELPVGRVDRSVRTLEHPTGHTLTTIMLSWQVSQNAGTPNWPGWHYQLGKSVRTLEHSIERSFDNKSLSWQVKLICHLNVPRKCIIIYNLLMSTISLKMCHMSMTFTFTIRLELFLGTFIMLTILVYNQCQKCGTCVWYYKISFSWNILIVLWLIIVFLQHSDYLVT